MGLGLGIALGGVVDEASTGLGTGRGEAGVAALGGEVTAWSESGGAAGGGCKGETAVVGRCGDGPMLE